MLDKTLIENEFSDLRDVVFLNISSVAIPPKCVQNAYYGFTKDYISNYGEGVVGRAWEIVGAARKDVAQLIGADASEIAFVKNTSEGIGIIANGYPFRCGDNIIVVDQEHSSSLFAWIGLQSKGIELKIVPSHRGDIEIDDIFALVNARTKAVCISAVQFTTGFYVDLYKLGDYCEQHKILLIVDGIQAVGRLHIDVKRMKISYLACGGNKGLLATLGAGFVFCDRQLIEHIVPPYASYQSIVNRVQPPAITQNFAELEWHQDARRLEAGNLNYAGIAAIQAGASLINKLGINEIQRHILELDEYLVASLKELPLDLQVPIQKSNHSGIVCVYYPPEIESQVVSILKQHKIYATMRGGYMRFGINFYNTLEHMDVVIKALDDVARLYTI